MPKSRATEIGQRVRLFFENFWIYVLLFPVIPIVLLPVVGSFLGKKKINLSKIPFLKKTEKNVRK